MFYIRKVKVTSVIYEIYETPYEKKPAYIEKDGKSVHCFDAEKQQTVIIEDFRPLNALEEQLLKTFPFPE